MFIYVFLVTVFSSKQSLTDEVLTDLDKRGLESSLQSPLFALRRLSGSSQQALRRLSAQESLRKLSGSSQETLSSGIFQKALRKLSGDSQLRNLSESSQEALRRLSGSSQETLSSRHEYNKTCLYTYFL